MTEYARHGWESNFSLFQETQPTSISEKLQNFIVDASTSQIRAWNESIPKFQQQQERYQRLTASVK